MRYVKDLESIIQDEAHSFNWCELLTKVYINLIDQKEPALNLTDNEVSNSLTNQGSLEYF